MPGPLVIGVGNPLRGDDAFGPRVAQGLAARGVPAVVHDADGLGLIHLWAGHDLARTLNRLPRCLVVHAVAGQAFGLGEAMTPAVEGMVEVLVQALAAELAAD